MKAMFLLGAEWGYPTDEIEIDIRDLDEPMGTCTTVLPAGFAPFEDTFLIKNQANGTIVIEKCALDVINY